MRSGLRYLAFALVLWGMALTGCQKGEVLIDNQERTVITDSLSIRTMASVPDSSQVIINTTTSWTANVSRGGEWCSISKNQGKKGRDTIVVHVDENPTTQLRQTSIVLESGNTVKLFRVYQSAGESWYDTDYWHRTTAQRLGLRGKVQLIEQTDSKYRTKTYTYIFDNRGNLTSQYTDDEEFSRFDTTRTYTYDEDNHRLTLAVKDEHENIVCKWRYEYNNTGRLTAYSAKDWRDTNPLSESMEGMVVPDLSETYGSWIDGDDECGERRWYTFDSSDRLTIISRRWRVSGADTVSKDCDTVRVEYRNGLPYTSKYISNTTYFKNGMIRMISMQGGKYEYLDNSQKMVPTSFTYNTNNTLADKEVEWYEFTYNFNRDPLERRVQYHGVDFVTVDKYSQYQYDNMYNWIIHSREVPYPGYTQGQEHVVRREISYFR